MTVFYFAEGQGNLRHTTPHFMAYFWGVLLADMGVGVVEIILIMAQEVTKEKGIFTLERRFAEDIGSIQ